MNFEVHFSSAAQDDIEQILDYISVALCSPIAAKNLMGKIQESSLYCVSFIADRKQNSHQHYLYFKHRRIQKNRPTGLDYASRD